MRSAMKYILVTALVSTGAVALGQDRPAGSATRNARRPDGPDREERREVPRHHLPVRSVDHAGHDRRQRAAVGVPSYQWWFSFRPRYYIKKNVSLRLRTDLTMEWTNGGADTTYQREAQFGDMWLDLAYNPPSFGASSRQLLSHGVGHLERGASQHRRPQRGPTVGLVREFQTKKAGSFELSLSMYGLYHFVQ